MFIFRFVVARAILLGEKMSRNIDNVGAHVCARRSSPFCRGGAVAVQENCSVEKKENSSG